MKREMGIGEWQNFFVMVGGGAATLAGLVFIAMSINLPIITRDATHKNRAVATMTGFTAVFMICAFALIGNQNYQRIGVEWLVVTLVPTITCIRVYVLARKTGRSSVGLSIGRFIAPANWPARPVGGGAGMKLRNPFKPKTKKVNPISKRAINEAIFI
jgi:hypothetical protein